jgi:hypothetical protein
MRSTLWVLVEPEHGCAFAWYHAKATRRRHRLVAAADIVMVTEDPLDRQDFGVLVAPVGHSTDDDGGRRRTTTS